MIGRLRRLRPRAVVPVLLVGGLLVLSATSASAETATDSESSETTTGQPAESGPETTTTTTAETDDPVPCEVAMVVGCVATVDGPDGSKPVTLQIAGDGASADDEEETTEGQSQGGQTGEDDERPVQSGIDPWERGGLRSNFGTQSIPISHYQIGADVTGLLGVPDPLDSFVASQTNWAFTTTTFLVILATNALQWAFDFPLAEDLIGDAGVLAQTYTVDFFGFGLSTSVYGLALTVTMIFAGFKAVTKGMIAAGSEVLLAFAAYVVLMVLTLTSGFGDLGLNVARLSSDVSGSIAEFAAGDSSQEECAEDIAPASIAGAEASTVPDENSTASSSTSAGSSACSFGYAMQRSLVEMPYQNLQWGQVLTGVPGKERCAEINLELLREGPWGNSDEPRERMGAEAACKENADFNHQATYIRLGIASAHTVAAATVTLLILVVCAMLLWQQVKLLFLTVTMPHALVFAILPGRSRKVAWQWIEQLVGVIVRTVILSLGLVVWLSLFSLIVHEQLTFRGIFLSFFASIAMAVSGFYGLHRLGSMTRGITPAVDRVSRARSDSSDGAGPSGGSGPTSPGALVVARQAQSTFRSIRPRPASSGLNGREREKTLVR